MEKALITKIVKDSILDGPGCRYVIFMKGCNLACPWCHNPETQSKQQEILTYPKFCIRCGNCVEAAPEGHPLDVMPVEVDNSRVEEYKACVERCPTNALEFAGKEYSTGEIISDMAKYKTIYKKTGGGITLSGGDPLCNPNFSMELLKKASEQNFHTAVDTAGCFAWAEMERLTPYTDLWLYDMKHVYDPQLGSSQSINNLLKLASRGKNNIYVRVPIIPQFNDMENILEQMAYILEKAQSGIKQVDILPFHSYGKEKYDALNRDFHFKNQKDLEGENLGHILKFFYRKLPKNMIHIGRNMVHG